MPGNTPTTDPSEAPHPTNEGAPRAELLTVSQVCSRIPGARGARHVTPSTVTRWILTGCPSLTGKRVKLVATRRRVAMADPTRGPGRVLRRAQGRASRRAPDETHQPDCCTAQSRSRRPRTGAPWCVVVPIERERAGVLSNSPRLRECACEYPIPSEHERQRSAPTRHSGSRRLAPVNGFRAVPTRSAREEIDLQGMVGAIAGGGPLHRGRPTRRDGRPALRRRAAETLARHRGPGQRAGRRTGRRTPSRDGDE